MRVLKYSAVVAVLVAGSAAQAATVYATNGLARPLAGADDLIRFDSSNPAGYVTVGSMNVSNIGFGGLDFDRGGNLWAYASFYKNTGGAASGLYRVNATTGAATAVGSTLQSLQDIAFNPVDNQMYGINSQNNVSKLYRINLGTGVVSNVGTFTGLPAAQHVMSFAIDSSGAFYVHELNEDKIYKGSGLSLAPLYTLPQDTNFSQGMTIDWSNGDTGYHAAVGYGEYPHYFSQVNTFTTNGSGYTLGGDFGAELGDGLPQVECGDLAIAPVPAPGLAALLLGATPALARRRR